MADLDATTSSRRCGRCNAVLPSGTSDDQCPKCLLEAGLRTQPFPRSAHGEAPPVLDVRSRGLPQPGDQFGHYRIARLLGQGGMGAVFDAEDLDTGRRVALKVLSQTLDAPDARARFLREGRLAASINHPNSVYVFGTEEIAGTPVISMELVPGGTLHDRVLSRGPLAVHEAVDCMLDIIAGLEAAQRIGILHRDIKPSNCFRGEDGVVKIGDFGLSISTTARSDPALTGTGTLLGTPAYCSPEQLRGEELTARSDMYSVGATLYYLLTGRTPFDAQNMVQLLANALEKRPPSPRQFRKTIPRGLDVIVLRCLEKQSGDRFKSYDELRQALAPFGSTAPTPATLGLRFLAGTLDLMLLSASVGLVTVTVMGDPMEILNRMSRHTPGMLLWIVVGFLLHLAYFTISEGLWGMSPGKALCRLRVVGPDNGAPGIPRALARSLFYVLLPMAPYWISCGGDPTALLKKSTSLSLLAQLSFYIVLALLFVTVRRRNGFAAIHDLITGTRVIQRASLKTRPTLSVVDTTPVAVEQKPRIGPYHVLESLGSGEGVEWILGYDLRLLRKVWLRLTPPGTPEVPASWRNLGRAGRLRWLVGRRSPEQNWDAFEGISGQPLLKLIRTPQRWSEVRFWLEDLAAELHAAQADGSMPPVLALDRVWITGDGRAKLLDFPAPGLGNSCPPSDGVNVPHESPTQFLSGIATAALAGGKPGAAVAVPLPLHVRAFLARLPELPDAAAVKAAIKPLLQRPAVVTRVRRAALVVGCLAFPLISTAGLVLSLHMMQSWNRKNPGILELSQLLDVRSAMHRFGPSGKAPDDRQFAIFIATHYRPLITNTEAWSQPLALAMIKDDGRRFAEQSLTNTAPTGEEIAGAEKALKPFVEGTPFSFTSDGKQWKGFSTTIVSGLFLAYGAIPALFVALLFRGGLVLRIAGVTFVRRDGLPASRLRLLWRGFLAWMPLWLLFGCTLLSSGNPSLLTGLFAGGLAIGLIIVSLVLPERGLQDRLAGTWPVPR